MVKKITLTSFDTNEKFSIFSSSILNTEWDDQHKYTLVCYHVDFLKMDTPQNHTFCKVKETEQEILNLINND